MQQFGIDDEYVKRIIRDIVRIEDDPSAWGETIWKDEVDPLVLWEWAESHNRIDFMSLLARQVVHHILTTTRFDAQKEEIRQTWIAKIEHFAKEAHEAGEGEVEVRFLEARHILNQINLNALETIDTIISLYKQLNRPKKVAYFLNERAVILNSLQVTGKLQTNEDEIWKSLIEAYRLSKNTDYDKGIALALSGLGYYLGRKHKDSLALKVLHQAEIYAKKVRTLFGITITEELRKIRDRSGIPPNAYEIEVDPDLLVEEFLKEV